MISRYLDVVKLNASLRRVMDFAYDASRLLAAEPSPDKREKGEFPRFGFAMGVIEDVFTASH